MPCSEPAYTSQGYNPAVLHLCGAVIVLQGQPLLTARALSCRCALLKLKLKA